MERFSEQAARLPMSEADPRHAAEAEALRTLASALDDLAVGHPALERNAGVVRDRAERIQASPANSLEHADWTREALLTAVDALDLVARDTQGTPELAEQARVARTAVEAIEPGVGMLRQRDATDRAFGEVAHGLDLSVRQKPGPVLGTR
ncbi:MAG: hypothetical protein ACOZNI_26220 [Myxococcota bacterium]